jgi:hypothetical protein
MKVYPISHGIGKKIFALSRRSEAYKGFKGEWKLITVKEGGARQRAFAYKGLMTPDQLTMRFNKKFGFFDPGVKVEIESG